MNKILVTGATGNIGRYVVEELLKKGKDVKVAIINEAEKPLVPKECETVVFDFLNPMTFTDALYGVERVFLVRPPQLAKPKQDMFPFLQTLKEEEIKQVVFVSLMGVEKNPIVPHRKIETMIRQLHIPHTFLRPSFFMQNLSTTHVDEIKSENELYIPVGNAKTSFIDTRDIGAVAATCFSDDRHLNKCYTLTGDESIDYFNVAKTLSSVLGKQVEYKNPTLLQFRKKTINRGIKKEFANVMTMLYLMTWLGTADKVTKDVKHVLKRDPISFKQFAIDHKHIWQ